jgi:hypothetical protein
MFDDVCSRLETVLAGDARAEIVRAAAFKSNMREALVKLRRAFELHAIELGGQKIKLTAEIRELDRATRVEGFNAMNDWNGPAVSISRTTIPVDMLNFVIEKRGTEDADLRVLAILVDFYFLYLLALLSLRVWDDGRPDDHIGRLQELLDHLQSEQGGGQLFASNAETLMIIATSHYEPEEHGYRLYLDRVKTLGWERQVYVALGHAQTMGCHLRFGYESTYNNNFTYMRDDNGADYPWLHYALGVLIRQYGQSRDPIVAEAILQGLSPDVDACIDHPEFNELFLQHRRELAAAFEPLKPLDAVYSPISLFFNFSQNALKGMVGDALLWGEPWPLTMDDLFTAIPADDPINALKERLCRTLMAHARQNPDLIRGKWMPAIVYDPQAARRAYNATMKRVRG